jgi:hypothetical protein
VTQVFIEPQAEPVKGLSDLSIHVDTIGYYNPFGGEDFDLALAKHLHRRLLEQYPELRELQLTRGQRLSVRLQLMNLAKQLKERISASLVAQQDPFADDVEQEQRYSTDLLVAGQQYAFEGHLSVDEYREVVSPLLVNDSRKSLLTPLRDLLNKTGFDPSRLDGLLLVGGMGRLPLVSETLQSFWGSERVWVCNPPDHAVVSGAAIYSYLRRRYPGFRLDEPAADAYYVRKQSGFDLILPANSKNKQGEVRRYMLDRESDKLSIEIFAGEEPTSRDRKEEIYWTLIYQGGRVINLGKTYPKDTQVFIQMRYEDEGGLDHTKVPWICVWIGNSNGEPLFKRRYTELEQ